MDKQNKLSNLIVKDDLDEEALSSILNRFIRIKADSSKIIILPDFSKLKSKDRIVILLLGFKALKLLTLREDEGVGPKEIHTISGINLSTVKNSLCDLESENMASSEKGKYSIPNFLLHSFKDYFSKLELSTQKKNVSKHRKSVRLDLSRINELLKLKPSDSFQKFYTLLIRERGKYLLKCLIVLYVAKEKFKINSLTAGEITHILKNFIGVPMIHQSNITTALGARDSAKYLFKEKDENAKYSYKLNAGGIELINQSLSEYESKRN
ncbi:MAG: hypothetical protein Q8N88_05065 [Nanoarchaeota archaeon]|nr:hypothetical protein [Nanoarchaeota archaeon]